MMLSGVLQRRALQFIGWKVHMMTSYDFLPMGSKHCNTDDSVYREGDYIEKYSTFGHVSCEYLGQPTNFFADPPTVNIILN